MKPKKTKNQYSKPLLVRYGDIKKFTKMDGDLGKDAMAGSYWSG